MIQNPRLARGTGPWCLPRVRFTLAAMMISVAVLGACMGLFALLARSSGMTPARLGVLVVGVAFWSAALNIAAFSILWLEQPPKRTL